MARTITTPQDSQQAADKNAIRPFHATVVPESDLTELRERVQATKWPERETVTDATQGVQLETTQALARHWATEYDWRKIEAKLHALPQFITEIDGLDIHFIHVRSKHENGLPLIVTHGWPGSIVEQIKIIDPLTNPTAHGGSASDAFHLVIPSLPGYGYSGKPTTTGWDPAHIARAWVVLMKRLGYTKFVAQTLYGIADSPVGLAAYFLDHDARSYELIARVFAGGSEGLTRDDILDNITITWLTNTALSGARLYWEYWGKGSYFNVKGVTIPVAVSVFPDELYPAPRSWAEQAFPKLIHFNKVAKGGHFAAWEQPQLFSEEVRAGFRSLRSNVAKSEVDFAKAS
jgi:pimeloyl-ACP methyl ester carboxylesterase